MAYAAEITNALPPPLTLKRHPVLPPNLLPPVQPHLPLLMKKPLLRLRPLLMRLLPQAPHHQLAPPPRRKPAVVLRKKPPAVLRRKPPAVLPTRKPQVLLPRQLPTLPLLPLRQRIPRALLQILLRLQPPIQRLQLVRLPSQRAHSLKQSPQILLPVALARELVLPPKQVKLQNSPQTPTLRPWRSPRIPFPPKRPTQVTRSLCSHQAKKFLKLARSL